MSMLILLCMHAQKQLISYHTEAAQQPSNEYIKRIHSHLIVLINGKRIHIAIVDSIN